MTANGKRPMRSDASNVRASVAFPVRPKRSKRDLSKLVKPKVIAAPVEFNEIDFEGLTIACSNRTKQNGYRFDFSRWVNDEKVLSGSNTGDLRVDCPLLYQLLRALTSNEYKIKSMSSTQGARKALFRGFNYVLPFVYEHNLVPIDNRLTVELWHQFIEQFLIKHKVNTFNSHVGAYLRVLVTAGELKDRYRRSMEPARDVQSDVLLLSMKDIRTQVSKHPYKALERNLKQKAMAILDRWDYVRTVIIERRDPKIQIAPYCLRSLRTPSMQTHHRVSYSDWDRALWKIANEQGQYNSLVYSPKEKCFKEVSRLINIKFEVNTTDDLHLVLHRQLLTKGLTSLRGDFQAKRQSGSREVPLETIGDVSKIDSVSYYTLAQSIWAAHEAMKINGSFCSVDSISQAKLKVMRNCLRDGYSWLIPGVEVMFILTSYLALKTGWNLETLASIPLDLDSCIESVSSKDPGVVKIWAYKGRSKRNQYVIDNVFSERDVYSQTAKNLGQEFRKRCVHKTSLNYVGYLLVKIREYLQFLNDNLFDVGLTDPNRRLLDHAGRNSGQWIGFSASDRQNGEVADWRRYGGVAKKVGLPGFNFQTARKLFAEYVALQSNFDIRKIQSRLGHRSPILSYICRVVFKVHGQLRLSDFQQMLVERLGDGKRIDPTLVKNQWINRHDGVYQIIEAKILEGRSQAGLVCETGYKVRDKDNILRDCETGRCALCKHGFIAADSWEGLARRLAELVYLQAESGLGYKAMEEHRIIDEQDRILANIYVHFEKEANQISEIWVSHYSQIKEKVQSNQSYVYNLLRGF